MTKRRKIVLAAAVLAVIVVGAGVFLFLRDDAPPEASLDSAKEGIESEGGEAVDDIAGSWAVDTETGEFDFESATGTFVGFRVEEELSTVGSTTAVGRTGDVTGSVEIEGTTLTAATFDADMTTLTTNESRRDDRVQDALETDQFPMATFELAEPVELGDGAADGEEVKVTAVGDLTIHGVTKRVEIELDAQLVESTVVIVGSTEVLFSDYGVTVPSAPIVVSVEDRGTVEFQLLMVKQ